MSYFISIFFCLLLLWGCSWGATSTSGSSDYNYDGSIENFYKAKFDSFLTQFAPYKHVGLDKSLFDVREKYSTERYEPEIDNFYFSLFLPYDDECKCEARQIVYRPCCKIERTNYYIVSFNGVCDIPRVACYPYDDNILATYDKTGRIIDFAIVGTASDAEAYKIYSLENDNEIAYTQYVFKASENLYDGDCDVATYKVTIDEDGNIDKCLIREEKNIKVTLSEKWYND